MRRDAVWALNRVHEALNDWGRDGQQEWYVNRLLAGLPGDMQEALAAGAQCAAKARQYHLGGVHRFWREAEALTKKKRGGLAREAGKVREEFRKCTKHFGSRHRLIPSGGTDYHGLDEENETMIGDIDLPMESLEQIVALARHRGLKSAMLPIFPS